MSDHTQTSVIKRIKRKYAIYIAKQNVLVLHKITISDRHLVYNAQWLTWKSLLTYLWSVERLWSMTMTRKQTVLTGTRTTQWNVYLSEWKAWNKKGMLCFPCTTICNNVSVQATRSLGLHIRAENLTKMLDDGAWYTAKDIQLQTLDCSHDFCILHHVNHIRADTETKGYCRFLEEFVKQIICTVWALLHPTWSPRQLDDLWPLNYTTCMHV